LAIIVLCSLVLAGAALASTEQSYDVAWWTVDGGGALSLRDDSSLSGTVGQPDAAVLEGGGYMLVGGFWPGGEAIVVGQYVYLPLVLK
jgi:hypothetical protein